MNKYESKLIRPELTKGIINEDDDTLALVAMCTGKSVARGRAPFIGRYVRIGADLVTERNPSVEHLEFRYLWAETTGILNSISIASERRGVLATWVAETGLWYNCYADGKALDRCWRDAGRGFPTLAEALQKRDYFIGDQPVTESALTEGPLLLRALHIASCVEEISR